jgi:hypothetical protein
MNLSDYEAVWKRQPPPVGANADLTILKQTFEKKSRRQAAHIQVRDYAEASSGIFVAIAYGFHWWQIGPAGWPLAIGILLILWVVAFFIRERLRARRNLARADTTLLVKIAHDLAELQHQRKLCRQVWAWYLAPCVGAMLAQSIVIFQHSKPWSVMREPAGIVSMIILISLPCWFAWLINLRAIRKTIEPRIAELEKLQRALLGPH